MGRVHRLWYIEVMIWLLVLALVSLALIVAGCQMASKRLNRYRRAAEARRERVFKEMMGMGKDRTQQAQRRSPLD